MSDTPLPSYPSNAHNPDDSPTFMSEVTDLLRQLKLTPTADGSVPRAPAEPEVPEALPTVPGYEILGELGRGGMGVVYKARQTGLNRVVALKMVLCAKTAGTNELLRFLAEAEAVAAVRHPNVVEVYELGQCGGRPYFAMEFVPGGSLADRLRAKEGEPPPPRLTPVEVATLLAAVARGVHAAHEADIVHRDLKPANILISAECGMRNAESKTQFGSDGS
ncbi:MAG TPA: serine/threonine-protein kinase, partial [Gemmataceae bacterium]|nr:serine/threonine-protein kinase [Gemmataceae bacterium]